MPVVTPFIMITNLVEVGNRNCCSFVTLLNSNLAKHLFNSFEVCNGRRDTQPMTDASIKLPVLVVQHQVGLLSREEMYCCWDLVVWPGSVPSGSG